MHTYRCPSLLPPSHTARRRIPEKISWDQAIANPDFFTVLMYARAGTWYTMLAWSASDEIMFQRDHVANGILEALWEFSTTHEFYTGRAGLHIRCLGSEDTVLASPEPTSHTVTAMHGFDAILYASWMSLRRILLLINLMHRHAGRLFSVTLPAGWSTVAATYIDAPDNDLFAATFRPSIAATVRDITENFLAVPGVVAITDERFRLLLDSTDDLDHTQLFAHFSTVYSFSLQDLLSPSNHATFVDPNDNRLRSWIGFMIHPLFSKLLPPPVKGSIGRYEFVNADGTPPTRHYLTHYVRTPEGPLYWPADQRTALRVSMQLYENARRAVSYSPIARAEWLQVRAIVGAANLRRVFDPSQQVATSPHALFIIALTLFAGLHRRQRAQPGDPQDPGQHGPRHAAAPHSPRGRRPRPLQARTRNPPPHLHAPRHVPRPRAPPAPLPQASAHSPVMVHRLHHPRRHDRRLPTLPMPLRHPGRHRREWPCAGVHHSFISVFVPHSQHQHRRTPAPTSSTAPVTASTTPPSRRSTTWTSRTRATPFASPSPGTTPSPYSPTATSTPSTASPTSSSPPKSRSAPALSRTSNASASSRRHP